MAGRGCGAGGLWPLGLAAAYQVYEVKGKVLLADGKPLTAAGSTSCPRATCP